METVRGAAQLWSRVDCVSLRGHCLDYRTPPYDALSRDWHSLEYSDHLLADVVALLSNLSAFFGMEDDLHAFAYHVVGGSRALGYLPVLCTHAPASGTKSRPVGALVRRVSKTGEHVSMTIEMKQIARLTHACDGCKNKDPNQSCCATYEVCITPAEVDAIVGVLPEASKDCPELKDGDDFQNVFEETDDGLVCLDTTEDGLCVFAYQAEGEVRCALHSAAERLKIPLEEVKPAVCLLWPLSISDDEPRLSIADDALEFHCNTRRDSTQPLTQSAFMDTIELVYGTDVREQTVNAAEAGCEQATVSLRRSHDGTRIRGT